MALIEQTSGAQVRAFCEHIGRDPLLVQGAGGNVSWKNGELLWVKASGTCLANALEKDIFVPIELTHLRRAIEKKDFHTIPKVRGDTKLKPSIETLFHALMPHKVVVHLHAVEILAHLVRTNPVDEFKRLIGNSIKWTYVDYFKPGAELASAIAEKLLNKPKVDVVFLQNHGVVIGGECVSEIENLLQKLLILLHNRITPIMKNLDAINGSFSHHSQTYIPCTDSDINLLATNEFLSQRLEYEWALYPDHAVFLGGQAAILGNSMTLENIDTLIDNKPAYVFDLGKGVYENKAVTKAQKLQIRCYYEVLIRQPIDEKLVTLSPTSIIELLNWDAEKFRKSQSRN
jgi:rhamnose utilization protein RhaD (predicted bifunctional aldolase and dehydrogenase)